MLYSTIWRSLFLAMPIVSGNAYTYTFKQATSFKDNEHNGSLSDIRKKGARKVPAVFLSPSDRIFPAIDN